MVGHEGFRGRGGEGVKEETEQPSRTGHAEGVELWSFCGVQAWSHVLDTRLGEIRRLASDLLVSI